MACGRRSIGGSYVRLPRSRGGATVAIPVEVKPEIRESRQLEAFMMGAALDTMVRAVIPNNLSGDVRDDLRQELELAALEGDFDLSDLAVMVPFYLRKIYRLSANRFKFVSLSSIIPGTKNLTYADTLIG
jgi:hypothetical protein